MWTLRSHAGERSLKDCTIELIDSAKQEIVACAYSFVAMENHPVGQAFRRAIERGVRILLVLRTRNFAEAQRRSLFAVFGKAPTSQLTIVGEPKTHGKLLTVDGERGLLWTGNFDGSHGYDSGVEVGFRSETADEVAGWRKRVLDLARRSTHTVVFSPKLNEMARFTKTKLPTLSGALTVRLAPTLRTARERLASALQSEIVSYGQPSPERLFIKTGADIWHGAWDPTKRILEIQTTDRRPVEFGGYVADCHVSIEVAETPKGVTA